MAGPMRERGTTYCAGLTFRGLKVRSPEMRGKGRTIMRCLPKYFLRQLTLPIFLTALALSMGCGSSKPADKENEDRVEAADCTEPSNPYAPGTGHYAGYEWAERNGSGDC